jgi:hypothetical protein
MIRNLQIGTNLHYNYDSFIFDENFEILQHSGYRTNSILLYTDYKSNPDYDLDQDCIIADTRENRIKIQRYLTKQGYMRVSEVAGDLQELIEDIGYIDYSNVGELYELLNELDIPYSSNYDRIVSRGHSQGDYSVVLVDRVKMGNYDKARMRVWIDHVLWDSEIYGEIEISFQYTHNAVNITYNNIFDFRDYAKCTYELDSLDVDTIIKNINVPYKLSNNDLDEIKAALENIDYMDIKYPCTC